MGQRFHISSDRLVEASSDASGGDADGSVPGPDAHPRRSGGLHPRLHHTKI